MLSIKNIKRCMSSHEGSEAISVTLYWNGKKVGWAADDGWGGGWNIKVDANVEKEMNDWAKSLPARVAYDTTFESDLEWCIEDLIEEDLKRKQKAKIATKMNKFFAKHKAEFAAKGWGAVKVISPNSYACLPTNDKHPPEKAIERFKAKHPDVIISEWSVI